MDKEYTGEDLRAWRERLGMSDADADLMCAGLSFTGSTPHGPTDLPTGSDRRHSAEGTEKDGVYYQPYRLGLRAAYAQALAAEEKRRATHMRTFKNGEEARAERRRLGLSRQKLGSLAGVHPDAVAYLEAWNDEDWGFSKVDAPAITKALNKEAARQENISGAPVVPEGVRAWEDEGKTFIAVNGNISASMVVESTGAVLNIWQNELLPAAALRYAAELSEYRASKNNAKERERKLAVLKAAEEAHTAAICDTNKACVAKNKAFKEFKEACDAEERAREALVTAHKEAGAYF